MKAKQEDVVKARERQLVVKQSNLPTDGKKKGRSKKTKQIQVSLVLERCVFNIYNLNAQMFFPFGIIVS